MLTIGEVARVAGTTVRAVRHYHAVGLLPEPERDRSGYRRYGAAELLCLLRVRRLRELGLPLERIASLLTGPDSGLDDALDALDAELAAQAERIAARRAQLAAIRASNPHPDLPERLGRIFADAAARGTPRRALEQEKEVLLLDLALHPEQTETIIAGYERLYAHLTGDPGHKELTHRFDALADADPEDPAVDEVAAAFIAVLRDEMAATAEGCRVPDVPHSERIFRDWGDSLPPAQRRLMERVAELAEPPPAGSAVPEEP